MARCEDWSKRQAGGQEEEQTADREGRGRYGNGEPDDLVGR